LRAICEQNWNSVLDWIPAPALATANLIVFREQAPVAYGTGQHGEYIGEKSLFLHVNSVRIWSTLEA
jgi:hypothetical protein